MRKLQKIKFNDDAVTAIVGTVLLLAIAVAIFSSFMAYILSVPTPHSPPNANLVGTMADTNGIGTIEHQGGESWELLDTKIIVALGDAQEKQCNFTNGYSSNQNIILRDINSNQRWDVGELLNINCTGLFGGISGINVSFWNIEAYIIHLPSKSIIMNCLLNPGVTRYTPPIPGFAYTPSQPKTNEWITFNASKSFDPDGGNIVSYEWDFGDGTTGFGKIIDKRYTTIGTYNITLLITDDEGETASITTGSEITAQEYIPPPIIVKENEPPIIIIVSWDNSSRDGRIFFFLQAIDPDGDDENMTFQWDFGDGIISSEEDPIHTYNNSGYYNVTIVVTDEDGGQNQTTFPIHVPNILPQAGFSYQPRNISIDITINFNGDSPFSFDKDGTVVNWSWDFDGNGIIDGYGPTINHIYTNPGNQTIILNVTDNEGGWDIEQKVLKVSLTSTASSPRFLLVDNTPTNTPPGLWPSGIDNVIAACQALMPQSSFSYGKAIDQWAFTNDEFTSPDLQGVNITETVINEFDIVLWSTGDFPGDGGNANYDGNANTWSTAMTEGSDDTSNHVFEIAEHLTGNKTAGTLLMFGTYTARDLQDYPGNGANDDEEWLGNILGLLEPTGGITYDSDTVPYSGRMSGSTGLGYSYFRGEPYYAAGTLDGIASTSTDGSIIATLNITSPINLYALNKQNNESFVYSLQSASSQGGGTLLDEDMETDPGWTHGGNQDEWERGVPTIGPEDAHSGSRVYGTDIDYYYNNNADCWLKTPEIDLTDCSIVTLEFYDWYRIVYDYYGTYDHVYLEITDDGGFSWNPLDDFHGSQQSWTYHSYDLSSYVDNTIQIRWRLDSDNSYRSYGYYLDDVTITSTSSAIPAGYYAIDADRDTNRTIILGFDLNADEITNSSRTNYLRNTLAWLAEGAGFMTEVWVNNDPPAGWLDDPAHVASIQEGIDAVTPGGTVYVNGSSGQIYHENVLLSKSIDLRGIDNPTIEIDGEYGIKAIIDWAKIDGFQITGDALNMGILFENSASSTLINCTIYNVGKAVCLDNAHNISIQDNILRNSTFGLYATYSMGNRIKNNEIYSNSDYGINLPNVNLFILQENTICYNGKGGIRIEEARFNTIINNTIHHNTGLGIFLTKVAQGNDIHDNWIYNNTIAIQLDTSNNNDIFNNMIFNNTGFGIFANMSSHSNILNTNVLSNNLGGVKISVSSNNYVINNTICNNAFGIQLATSTGNTIMYNTIDNQTNEGLSIFPNSDENIIFSNSFCHGGEGIYLEESKYNEITKNTISYNNGTGIFLYQAHPSILGNNDIINNTVSHNNGIGIYVSASNGNDFLYNNIFNNSEDGVCVISSNENIIRNNYIINNSDGIYLQTSTLNIIDCNNISINRGDGIALRLYCSYNEIESNIVNGNNNGIFVYRCYNSNSIYNNSITDSTDYGIFSESSESNLLNANLVNSNGKTGILFIQSDLNTVQNNTVSLNSDCGMEIFASEFNVVVNNDFLGNQNHGLTLVTSNEFTDGDSSISGNYISGNGGYGVYLLESNGNIIHNNTVTDNSIGMYFSSSDENNLEGNTIFSNSIDGIHLADSSTFNTVENNTLWGNTYGIVVNDSDIPIIQYNELFWHNDSAGVSIRGSTLGSSYPVCKNHFHNNNIAIEITHSSGTHVNDNIVCNNSIAVFIENSNYVYVQDGNSIKFNIQAGVYIKHSSDGIIEDNEIFGNGVGVWLNSSDDNLVRHNNIAGNFQGVLINYTSDDNIVKENNITINLGNKHTVNISGGRCDNNYIYWNNFRNETFLNASLGFDSGGKGNCWYNPGSEDKKGNYWQNYQERYPDALPMPGGWWDTYYTIDGSGLRKDIRPLITPVGWW